MLTNFREFRMKKSLMTTLIAVSLSHYAIANETGTIITDSGLELTPLLETGIKHDNNIFSQPKGSEVSSNILTIDPSIKVLSTDGLNYWALDAKVRSGFYTKDLGDGSDDDYVDLELEMTRHQELGEKHRFDINANINWTSEPRGKGLTEGTAEEINEPVRYAEQLIGGMYEYGSESSVGKVAVMGRFVNRDHKNFREFTQYRDTESLLVGTQLKYDTQNATTWLVEVTHDAIRYDILEQDGRSRDSDDLRGLVGVEWQATALTSGSVKVGYQDKKFFDTRNEFSGLSWEASVKWEPLTYSSLEFETSNAAIEPRVEGDFIEQTRYDLTWDHDWNDFMTTRFGIEFLQEDYSGNDLAGDVLIRDDETFTYSFLMNYDITNSTTFSLFADVVDKDSTNVDLLHDKKTVGVNFTFTL